MSVEFAYRVVNVNKVITPIKLVIADNLPKYSEPDFANLTYSIMQINALVILVESKIYYLKWRLISCMIPDLDCFCSSF